MKTKITNDAIEILKHRIDQDHELASYVEEERRRLNLADKIKKARMEAGLSQSDAADE